jgi:hypothetical protein
MANTTQRGTKREGVEAVEVFDNERPVTYREPAVDDSAWMSHSATLVNPIDRVRWGPILAGLFATLSSLVVLSLLGIAIGLSSYDAGDPLSSFGIGAGIWSAISTLLAFAIGGWLAAKTAATRGRNNGLLNGAMVWVVAIPLILYLLSTGVGSLLNMATDAAAAGASAAAAGLEAVPGGAAAAGDAAANAQAQATAVAGQVNPETAETAAENSSPAVWGTLLALLLGLAAAAMGGLIGARPTPVHEPM